MRARALAFVLIAACVGVAALAGAAGDDRGAAESALKEVASSSRKDVAHELVTRSRAALDRGAAIRTKGDEAHARLADSLAKTWAEAAGDAVKAAVVEESAAKARIDATDAGIVSDRERALLEEAVAQSGRLRAQLEAAPGKTQEQPARTSAAATSDAGASSKTAGDGGAPKPKTKPAPAKDAGGAP